MTTPRAASAGANAQAEYERRAASHEARIVRDRSQVALTAAAVIAAGLVLMLVGPGWWLFGLVLAIAAVIGAVTMLVTRAGQATVSRVDAEAGLETAVQLAELEATGYRILRARRVPGTRATIDRIVVGPTGVFVVESMSWSGRVRVQDGEVRVAGRSDQVIARAYREADAVAVALPCVQVTPIVCVHRADLPPDPLLADGVPVVSGRGLIRRLREGPAHLSAADIDRLIGQLDTRLPSAT